MKKVRRWRRRRKKRLLAQRYRSGRWVAAFAPPLLDRLAHPAMHRAEQAAFMRGLPAHERSS